MSEEKIEQIVGSGYESHAHPTTLTAKQQEKLWRRHIRPILKKCKLTISPAFNDAVISEFALDKIERDIYSFDTGLPYNELKKEHPSFETALQMISRRAPDDALTKVVDGFLDYVIGAGKLPHLMAFFNRYYPAPERAKKLRPSQEAKKECRAIAKELWAVDPNIPIKDMAVHPKIAKAGKDYRPETRRGWVAKVAPEHLHKGGRREGT
jgi:hypothetical protein